jgi:hypothetical protein
MIVEPKETKELQLITIEETLENDYHRKDQKEQRHLTKSTLYDGSKKLKHTTPKGKRV